MILLVRHALPLIAADVPPAEWRLSAEGKISARRIFHSLPAESVLVSSPEPKARDTLVLATGGAVTTDARLGEVRRPFQPFGGDHRSLRLRYVSGQPPEGWEPPAHVVARIDAVIADHRVADKPLVLAGHGMAFTTWLTLHGYVDDPAAFWAALRFPDVLGVHEGAVHRLLET